MKFIMNLSTSLFVTFILLRSDAQPQNAVRRFLNNHGFRRESYPGYDYSSQNRNYDYSTTSTAFPSVPYQPSYSGTNSSYNRNHQPASPTQEQNAAANAEVQRTLVQAQKVITAGNQFGFGLMKVLISDNDNTIIAPVSLSIALGMLYYAADGNTKRELSRALQYDKYGLDSQTLFTPVKQLTSLSKSTGPQGFSFELANLIFAQKGLNISQAYRNVVREVFSGSVEDVDFTRPAETLSRMNQKITKATNGQISNPVEGLNPGTRVILTNAVYFKGFWKKPFSVRSSFDSTFFNDGLDEVPVKMMYTRDSFYVKSLPNLDADAIQLPYEGDFTVMLILLPKSPTGVNQMLRKLNVAQMISELPTYVNETLDLHIPRFNVQGSNRLKQQLRDIGIRDIFLKGRAELPELDPSGELVVDDVIHEAKINVDEQGTEASGVTAATIINYSRFPAFNVRHPFVFFIIHKQTGSIFFAGKIIRINSQDGPPPPSPSAPPSKPSYRQTYSPGK